MATTLKHKRLNKKDMRILIAIALCFILFACNDKPKDIVDRANIKISELPAASTLDTNDLFVISDAGSVSRSLKGRKIADAISDSVTVVRDEVDTAKVNLRAEISGGTGAFSKTGNQVSLTVTGDTVNLGTNGSEKLNVSGGGYFLDGDITATGDGTTGGNINAYVLNLNQNSGSSGRVFSAGDDLYLGDNTNGWKKLSDLVSAGGYFSFNNTTITPILTEYNLNIGSLNETTRKLKVNGSFEVTQDVHLGAVNYDVYLNDNANLRLDESSRILFSNTGSSDNLAIYPVGSHGLRINNYYYTNGSYLDINTNDGAYGKEITDEHNVGVNWNADSTMSFITYNGGHEATMTFNGDSIHVYNPTESLDYWIGTTITGGSVGASNVWQISNDTTYLIENNNIISLSNGTVNSKLYVSNTSSGKGFHVANVSTGTGVSISNSSTGAGNRITNSGAGTGIWIDNDEGTGIKVESNSDGDVLISVSGSFDADTTFRVSSTGSVRLSDSLILKMFEGETAGSLWFTNTISGAIDSAHTEPAYIGWEMKDLPTLEEYEKDVKMINGHMERRVWYIDYETKELKSQYGWSGLGMMNTQSAYMIYHEITVRWMFEQNKKIAELQKVQIPADVTNILLALNGLKYAIFVLFGLFIFLIAFSIIINRK